MRFGSVDELEEALARRDYLPDRGLATALFLALALERPLLLEGEAASARPRWRRRSRGGPARG